MVWSTEENSGLQEGYSRGTGRVQEGYRNGTGGVQEGYRKGTGGVQEGYRRGTGRVLRRSRGWWWSRGFHCCAL